MDMSYIFMLYEYCREIQEHEAALLEIQTKFIPCLLLSLYRLQPIVQLLFKVKTLLHRSIHPCERDTMRMTRVDWQACHFHLLTIIDLKWCCWFF